MSILILLLKIVTIGLGYLIFAFIADWMEDREEKREKGSSD